MLRTNGRILVILTMLLAGFCATTDAQAVRERTTQNVCSATAGLTGVYRIDTENSDRLYSIIEEASSNVPFAEQQQFFMDLAVRLTPPDLLAIECRGNRVTLGSSRAQKVVFQADGVTRSSRGGNGQVVRSRINLEPDKLVFSSSGGSNDNLSFSFTPLENGQRLRVTRRISSKELVEPVVIQTVYNKSPMSPDGIFTAKRRLTDRLPDGTLEIRRLPFLRVRVHHEMRATKPERFVKRSINGLTRRTGATSKSKCPFICRN
jgi:hypothetical protein